MKQDYITQIVEYIKKNLSKGYTLDSLRFALLNQDYSRTAIEKAIQIANEELANKIPPLKEKPIIRYEVVSNKDIKKEMKNKPKKKSFFKKLFSK